jgi:hypothetical protein
MNGIHVLMSGVCHTRDCFSPDGMSTANGDLRTVQYQQYPAPVITTCTQYIDTNGFVIDKTYKT